QEFSRSNENPRASSQGSRESAGYLLELYREKGIDFLQGLNGSFAGALVDAHAGKIFLFNDRFGLSRIYYSEKQGAMYFASEAKALLAVLPDTRAFNEVSL